MSLPKILVVDDMEEERRLMRSVLSPRGYDLREAEDGVQALESVDRDPPDLILMDLEMPRMDGFAACRRLKADPGTRLIPVVVVTGLEGFSEKLRALESGADEFLNKPVNPIELRTRVRSLLSLKHFTDELERAENVLASIAQVVETRDCYTGGHCGRVAEVAVRIGREVGMAAPELRDLKLGALFHDLGKISIPDAVLRKPGPLTPAEFETMKTHPGVGAKLFSSLQSLKNVIPIIRHHHERLDGSGYPDGLQAKDIALPVRIVSVSDVYDALTTHRPYRAAFSPARALAIIRAESEKGWWDRDIVAHVACLVAGDRGERTPLSAPGGTR